MTLSLERNPLENAADNQADGSGVGVQGNDVGAILMRSWIFLILIAVCLFGCVFADPAYSPVVRNETRAPVRIVLRWEVGPDQPAYLQPGAACFQGVKNRQLTGITVKSDEGWTREYGRLFLGQVRGTQPSSDEVWLIRNRSLSRKQRKPKKEKGVRATIDTPTSI